MAKTIRITFYNPKELWIKFCNWVFWPRHKKCVEWCDYYDGVLCGKIVQILQEANENSEISDYAAEKLEVKLKAASESVSKLTAKFMSEGYKYD